MKVKITFENGIIATGTLSIEEFNRLIETTDFPTLGELSNDWGKIIVEKVERLDK